MSAGMQAAAFVLCVGLLAWCVRGAFSESNRAQWSRLRDADAWTVAAVLGLTGATLAINGLIFWATIRPVRRLGIVDLQATNAVGTLLALAPFKVSILFRVLVHVRRDRVPLVTVGAWFVAVTIGISAATNPVFFTSLARPTVDGWWVLIVAAGLVVSHAAVCGLARVFAGERGLARLRRVAAWVLPGRLKTLAAGEAVSKAAAGFDMAAHPWWLAAQMGLRVLDLMVLGVRLWLCARIVGVEVSFGGAIVYGAFHFAIGALSPAGALGAREGLTAIVASRMQGFSPESFAVVMLLLLASEALVVVPAALAGVLRLRPDRLLRGWRGHAAGKDGATPGRST